MIGLRVLPPPNKIARTAENFEVWYTDVDNFLAADEIELAAIWTLPDLRSDLFPVRLDARTELDVMSDREFGYALNNGIIRSGHARAGFMPREFEQRTCARYRYLLPKIVGDHDVRETLRAGQEIGDQLLHIEAALKESLSIVLPNAVGVAGRFGMVNQPGSMIGGGAPHQEAMLPQGWRRTLMDADQAAELVQVWTWVWQPQLLQRQKGLALALRRLSYHAQRERPEDELLDTMIAAEALYLTGLGNEAERGELRYRLALRAALWANPEKVGFTRREVFGIMKSAYDARSAIAHGGIPDPKGIKLRGQRVSLSKLAQTAKSVTTTGCRAALERAASGEGWPPDWDALILDNYQHER
jgi:hypothetical protein